jgi:hypothetical protein
MQELRITIRELAKVSNNPGNDFSTLSKLSFSESLTELRTICRVFSKAAICVVKLEYV